ncbi:MAG: hypothetical protein ABIQ99_17000 [Thermoflexales bacterium]
MLRPARPLPGRGPQWAWSGHWTRDLADVRACPVSGRDRDVRWARERLGDAGGLGAAAANALAPYVLLDVMARSALAEVLALAIVPWVFWARSPVCKARAGPSMARWRP